MLIGTATPPGATPSIVLVEPVESFGQSNLKALNWFELLALLKADC